MKNLDLIDRNSAIEKITEALDFVGSRDINCAVSALQSIPETPCIQRIESHWIRLPMYSERPNYPYSDQYICSNCETIIHLATPESDCDYDFCPMCAAVMCGETINAENG